jgi:hypothetical protein
MPPLILQGMSMMARPIEDTLLPPARAYVFMRQRFLFDFLSKKY